jgi:hypothetical protein
VNGAVGRDSERRRSEDSGQSNSVPLWELSLLSKSVEISKYHLGVNVLIQGMPWHCVVKTKDLDVNVCCHLLPHSRGMITSVSE